MTTKQEVHRLLDQLPKDDLGTAKLFLEFLRYKNDPVLKAFLTAPEDDEPVTKEEQAALDEAYEDVRAGRMVSHKEAKRRLLGRK